MTRSSRIRRAMRFEPDLAEAYANLGTALMDAGRPEEAIDAFRRAIAIQPKLTEALSTWVSL